MVNAVMLESSSLTLVASTAAHVRTELEAPQELTRLLGATVSSQWPSGEYDRDAMEFFLARFEEGGESAAGWYGWYALSPDDAAAPRALLGSGGYFGPPDSRGSVEIGYSILPEWQGRGYASEVVRMLVAHAFTFPEIKQIRAHTAEANTASKKVLSRCNFQLIGPGSEDGTLRYEINR